MVAPNYKDLTNSNYRYTEPPEITVVLVVYDDGQLVWTPVNEVRQGVLRDAFILKEHRKRPQV